MFTVEWQRAGQVTGVSGDGRHGLANRIESLPLQFGLHSFIDLLLFLFMLLLINCFDCFRLKS